MGGEIVGNVQEPVRGVTMADAFQEVPPEPGTCKHTATE